MWSRRPARPEGHRQAGLRWLGADARDVAEIRPGRPRPPVAVTSAANALRRWQRRVERRRLLALARRSALVALAAACIAELLALAMGAEGAGWWLVPAALAGLACLALGLRVRTSSATAARMLDRDLDLGAKLSTALELETGVDRPRGLGALALADGRGALAESLTGARARLRPRTGELALLGAFVAAFAVLLAVPSPRGGGTQAVRHAAPAARTGAAVDARPASSGGVGATLSGFGHKQAIAPPLTALSPGSTRGTGTLSGHSPYGSGVATTTPAGSIQPVSQTVGPVGSLAGTTASGAATAASSEGKGANAQGSVGAKDEGSAGQASSAQGAQGVSPVAGGQPAAAGQTRATGSAAATGGSSQGGSGSSAPSATGQRTSSGHTTPGGASAGATPGARGSAQGIVPQLRAGSALPLQPGYEAVRGARGAPGENASASEGGGGSASHSGTATAGRGGAGAGVPYVPPGANGIGSLDRGLVQGYFGSFARVNASGW